MSETFQQQHDHDNWQEQERTSHADDRWHAHAGEAPPQHEHGSRASPIGIIVVAVASLVFVVVLVVLVMVYFNQRVRALRVEREERADFTSFVVGQMDHRQQMMGDYGWIDAENGVFRLPIERAIEITAQEYASQQ